MPHEMWVDLSSSPILAGRADWGIPASPKVKCGINNLGLSSAFWPGDGSTGSRSRAVFPEQLWVRSLSWAASWRVCGEWLTMMAIMQWSPTFLAPGPSFVKDNFSINGGKAGGGFGMIQAHCIYCTLYWNLLFLSMPFYYYTSSTSDHQAIDLRGWESSTLKDILVIQPWMEVVLEGKKWSIS